MSVIIQDLITKAKHKGFYKEHRQLVVNFDLGLVGETELREVIEKWLKSQ